MATVPHPKPKELAEQFDPAELLVLKPGVKVSIRLETNYTPGDNQKVYDALAKKLRDNGVEVVESSSLVLVGVSTKGKPKEMRYRGPGSNQTTTRSVTPLLYTLTVYEGEDNVWSTAGSGGAGFLISMKRGETLDDAIRRLSQPATTFFEGLQMPKLLARQASGGLRQSPIRGVGDDVRRNEGFATRWTLIGRQRLLAPVFSLLSSRSCLLAPVFSLLSSRSCLLAALFRHPAAEGFCH